MLVDIRGTMQLSEQIVLLARERIIWMTETVPLSLKTVAGVFSKANENRAS